MMGGFLAFGILHISLAGESGWRWLFFIEV
jgi:hypothetical protein